MLRLNIYDSKLLKKNQIWYYPRMNAILGMWYLIIEDSKMKIPSKKFSVFQI